MSRLPLTVIGGYLGAGKTTLINRLLIGGHGKRLMVMVNDFGAVNIDVALLASATEDTLELTNGCVCCTMGADLFMALGDVLDRPNRPDHLIIEASGIADPARIAEVSRTEPDLSYAGIVTVVDGLNFPDLIKDAQIAPQLKAQVAVADLVLVSKTVGTPDLTDSLARIGAPRVLPAETDLGPLLWDFSGEAPRVAEGHAHFTKWSHESDASYEQEALAAKLRNRPKGLYRVKGFLRGEDGMGWQVQVVGKSVELVRIDQPARSVLVGIGPTGQLQSAQIDAWWQDGA